MIFDNLLINNKIWQQLIAARNNDRLPHSLLFYGPPGTGKEGHAIEIAGLLNCIQPTEHGACGFCKGCSKVRSFQHGNVHLIIPYPRSTNTAKKDDSAIDGLTKKNLDFLRTKLNKKSKNPYEKIELENANTILINSIRDLRKKIYLTNSDFGLKIILIFDAEKLCIPQPSAANALLKILEEPPQNAVLILVTSRISLMIDTIRSRCQQVYFPPLSTAVIKQSIRDDDINEGRANIIAFLSSGDIRLAHKFKKSIEKIYSDIELFGRAVFTSKPENWQTLIDKLSDLKRKSKMELNYFFRVMILFFRDLLVLQKTGNIDSITLLDFSDKLVILLEKFPNSDWAVCIEFMEDTIGYIEANGYLPLMILTMLIDIRAAILGKQEKHFELREWMAV